MKTNTHPGDYERHYAIIPQLEPLCSACGGFILAHPTGERKCVDCGGTEITQVLESDAAEFREIRRDAALWRDERDTRESVRP
jgi:ribosomal protein S27AE